MLNNKELKQAIVSKVEKILDNTDYMDTLYIQIEGSRETIPSIRYNIRELIVPKEEENENPEQ